MARTTRAAAAARQPAAQAKANARTKKEEPDVVVKKEETAPRKPAASTRKRASSAADKRSAKKVKTEDDGPTQLPSPSDSPSASPTHSAPATKSKPSTQSPKKASPEALRNRKLKAHLQYAGAKASPFPDFPHPTPSEAKLAHKILTQLHGARTRPTQVIARSDRAGCGDSPSVLDALVRTILSQNTSDANSTRAKRSMDSIYGGSDEWAAIVAGGQPKLQDAIKSGGLSVVKSKVIISILQQAHAKYGKYSLDHLHTASTEDAMQELLSFQGVGPKTASCVLLFCLQREDFAVDTHVHRITGLLGWRPQSCNREETYAHLNVRIPDEDKYGLHILLVGHGKKCDECRAGGRNGGKCELRRAFRRGKLEGEAGDEVKGQEKKVLVKKEEVQEE